MNKFSNTAVCFVADFKYLHKNFARIYNQLRTNGKYRDDIVIITNYFSPTFLIKDIRKKNGVNVLRFKKIKYDKKTEKSLKNLNVSQNRHIN